MPLALALNIAILAAVAAWVLQQLVPLSRAVRLRNALLFDAGAPGDFSWTPECVPASFRSERHAADPYFQSLVDRLLEGAEGDWNRALRLASHLAETARDLGPVQADLMTTYRAIREGYGYCADFVKIYMALAHAAGLQVRQWAFSFDGFGGHGHTFVEVWDGDRRKWRFLDVHNNLHFVDAAGEPQSALEVRRCLAEDPQALRMQDNGPGRPGFVDRDKGLEYFRRGASQWYLWWGNAVYSIYSQPLVRAAGRVSNAAAHLLAILLGLQPRIRALVLPENAGQVRSMFATRHRFQWTMGALAAALGLLGLQLALPA